MDLAKLIAQAVANSPPRTREVQALGTPGSPVGAMPGTSGYDMGGSLKDKMSQSMIYGWDTTTHGRGPNAPGWKTMWHNPSLLPPGMMMMSPNQSAVEAQMQASALQDVLDLLFSRQPYGFGQARMDRRGAEDTLEQLRGYESLPRVYE